MMAVPPSRRLTSRQTTVRTRMRAQKPQLSPPLAGTYFATFVRMDVE